MELRPELFNYLLALGDDALILGHRLSEWVGHGPQLEEEIALANIALDCLGHSAAFLEIAAAVEERGRTADELAFFRDAVDFRNCTVVELENGDFAHTMVRQLFMDAYRLLQFDALSGSGFAPLAAFAAKALKEVRYHFRHSSSWVIQLGDGTEVSKLRTQSAVDEIWRLVPELLAPLPDEEKLSAANLISVTPEFGTKWRTVLGDVLKEAKLTLPADQVTVGYDGRRGKHTEQLGHLLAELQSVARSAPGAKW